MDNPKGDVKSTEKGKHKRTRSPAYPFIDLETAIRRAKQFYDHEQDHPANVKVAVKHWDYEEKSSGGLQTAAALVAFGLMKDEGTGAHRKVQLTPAAISILLNPEPMEREEAVREAALAPKIHRQIWQKWDGRLPSDESLKYTLLTEWEPRFNANSVDGFIKQLKNTMSFAKLAESDIVSEEVKDSGGGDSGKSHDPLLGNKLQELRYKRPPLKENMQEFVVPLSEGNKAIFQWPSSLTNEDIDDLRDSLKILERKIARGKISEEKSSQEQ